MSRRNSLQYSQHSQQHRQQQRHQHDEHRSEQITLIPRHIRIHRQLYDAYQQKLGKTESDELCYIRETYDRNDMMFIGREMALMSLRQDNLIEFHPIWKNFAEQQGSNGSSISSNSLHFADTRSDFKQMSISGTYYAFLFSRVPRDKRTEFKELVEQREQELATASMSTAVAQPSPLMLTTAVEVPSIPVTKTQQVSTDTDDQNATSSMSSMSLDSAISLDTEIRQCRSATDDDVHSSDHESQTSMRNLLQPAPTHELTAAHYQRSTDPTDSVLQSMLPLDWQTHYKMMMKDRIAGFIRINILGERQGERVGSIQMSNEVPKFRGRGVGTEALAAAILFTANNSRTTRFTSWFSVSHGTIHGQWMFKNLGFRDVDDGSRSDSFYLVLDLTAEVYQRLVEKCGYFTGLIKTKYTYTPTERDLSDEMYQRFVRRYAAKQKKRVDEELYRKRDDAAPEPKSDSESDPTVIAPV
ncbi:hypothetical protein GQ42DRAFT_154399 [Ramicandelaber brevisporus]|nr:hypothetical protein GQ42DRAFT_154399 [Ramicandelaber brevisporus]